MTSLSHLVTREKQAQMTILLRDAASRMGEQAVRSFLPKPFSLSFSSHSTGCQMHIYLVDEGHPPIMAWDGSVWYSSTYEFNDRDKHLGLNPDTPFAGPLLHRFFEALQSAYVDTQANDIASKEQEKAEARNRKMEAIGHYQKLLEGKSL